MAGAKLRSVAGGSIGNLVEWYDWYVYSAFSLYFAARFFPHGDGTAQLLDAAAVFAIGFLMRPVGGWWLGRYADRRGRKAGLTLSVWLMCGGSLAIAVAPTYAQVGVAAPVILILARLVQGFSVGGEYGASATYLSELARDHNRGFIASFQYVTLIAGQLLALLVLVVLQAMLRETQLAHWGWRIPFAIGAAASFAALRLRRELVETDAFAALPRGPQPRLLDQLVRHRRAVVTIVALGAGGSLAFYTFTTYMQKFLVNSGGWSRGQASLTCAATLFVYMLIQPLFGALSDRVGRQRLLIGFGVFGMLGVVPLLQALEATVDHRSAFLLILAALTVLSAYTAISGVVKAELFPTDVRATGVGLPYAISVSLFGGTAEYAALAFKGAHHEAWFFWYVAAMCGVSLVAALSLPPLRLSTPKPRPGVAL